MDMGICSRFENPVARRKEQGGGIPGLYIEEVERKLFLHSPRMSSDILNDESTLVSHNHGWLRLGGERPHLRPEAKGNIQRRVGKKLETRAP